MRRAATLLPLGVVSVSWTLAVAGAGIVPAPLAGPGSALPEVSVPARAVEAPANAGNSVDGSVRPVRAVSISRQASALVPAPALAAYQRAATIIAGADNACGLQWSLLAAIGDVESDHGRVNGNALRDDGLAVPGIVGTVLDGSRGTAAISDTDAGRLDGDDSWDRAVGPMQFIPSTWAVVGVDGDDDGERNPQDVDDAALAAAVYLCSGSEDLSTEAGRRVAVLRYNRSATYADLVLGVARTYAAGSGLSTAAGLVVPSTGTGAVAPVNRDPGSGPKATSQVRPGAAAGSGAVAPSKQTDPDTDPGGGSGSGSGDNPGPNPGPEPKPEPSEPVKPAEVVTTLLTRTEAILACTLSGLSQLLQPGRFNDCVADRTS